jgi:hypothetical protein
MLLVEGSPWATEACRGTSIEPVRCVAGTLRGKIVDGNAKVRMQSQPAPRGPAPMRCLQIQRNGAIGDIEDFAAPPYRMA